MYSIRSWSAAYDNYIHFSFDKIRGMTWKTVEVTIGKARLNEDILSFLIPEVAHPLAEVVKIGDGSPADKSNPPDLGASLSEPWQSEQSAASK